MRIIRFVFMIILLISGSNLYAIGPRWGFVSGNRLISIHPLMQKFDPVQKRFVDTISAPKPAEDPLQYIARLNAKLEELKKTMLRLDANYAGKISGQGLAARKAWWIFWKKRESLKIYQNLIQEAINQVSVQGNFYLNMPSEWTIMPVAMAIASSVNDACEYLRGSYKLDAVFDVSVFNSRLEQLSQLDMIPNLHWKIWNGTAVNRDELNKMSDGMAISLRNSFKRLRSRPFVAGAIDLRQQSESLLTDITLPSSEIPGDDLNKGE